MGGKECDMTTEDDGMTRIRSAFLLFVFCFSETENAREGRGQDSVFCFIVFSVGIIETFSVWFLVCSFVVIANKYQIRDFVSFSLGCTTLRDYSLGESRICDHSILHNNQ